MSHPTTYPAHNQHRDRIDPLEYAALRERLRVRQAAIGQVWYRAIIASAALVLISATTCDSLTELVGQIIKALLAEPFVRESARAIGSSLPLVLGSQPIVLGTTLEILAGELVAGLPAHQAAALQPRLAALLGELSVGFLVQVQGARADHPPERQPPLADHRYQLRAAVHQRPERSSAAAPAPPRIALARRDGAILSWIVAGESNREIATLLSVGEKAVEKAVSALFVQLGVTTRVLAAVRAVREGLLEDTGPDR